MPAVRNFAVPAAMLLLAGCDGGEAAAPGHRVQGADAGRGPVLMAQYGCTACHRIPGVAGPRGVVGPPLTGFAGRVMIAGSFPNTPANLVAWLRDPPAMLPVTAMPDMGVGEAEARDMAAYLYTLD
ncbi:c-type cytochrome [Arenibaculum sp.]|jgi:cytochrome c1|uniref:c-type cytochrome n=1 Tax=Arenibaculum sp. TaxID=2865862 RepID=UPI002E13F7BC|nr:c-type cytochrome [Arenibaculum sp.]